ncbi:S8 family serine peptidase [Halovivax sp.]|uniref:S8 family serine peptidase n=1 Tax=Halovivax sp. TaxID=1935978 RepID=UPI0025C4985D|nr:S8 family serine peptidase [Halovivax sp.]
MTHQRSHTSDRRTVLKAAGAAGAFFGLTGVGSAGSDGDTEELVVKAEDVVGIADVKSTVETALSTDAEIVHENGVLGYVTVEVSVAEVDTVKDAVSTLEAQTGVEYAEENVEYRVVGAASDDPRFGDQYAPQQVNAPDAWDVTQGSDVVLSVIDQGVDYEHENLRDRFGSNVGYDFVNRNDDPMPVAPSENHGTHVAGIAAGTTNNGVGTSGVSNARILSARALGAEGGGSLQDIADAIQWSADQGADVINMSLGGGGRTDLMEDAVDYAFDSGTLPIAAAGNDGGPVSFPAAYDNCMAVSAIDSNYNAASFTNRGPEVDVTAGGVDVLSTDNDDRYVSMSGTSMSSPVAAGVACLGASAHGLTGNDRDPAQLWNLLTDAAEPVQGLPSDVEGDGLVDAANVVEDGGEPDPPDGPEAVIDASTTTPEVGETVDLDGSASQGDIDEYHWDAEPGNEATGAQVALHRDEEVAVDVTLSVTDSDGRTDSETITVDFGGDGEPACGHDESTASAEGSLDGGWWGDGDTYTYQLRTADPCEATVSLDTSADFELYLTLDGRTPSEWDHDERGTKIEVGLDGDEEFGLLVDAPAFTGGDYVLEVEELGK